MANPSSFFDGLREALRVNFGLNFNGDIQSIQAIEDKNFPWAMLRFESSVQMSVKVTNSTIDFDFPVGIEFAVLAGPETYQNAIIDFASEIATWINQASTINEIENFCGPCLINCRASGFQILGMHNSRVAGAGLINCNFKLRFKSECKF